MEIIELINIFESKGFNRNESVKVAEAINGKSGFATKEDLMEVKHELKEDINKLNQDIKWIKIIMSLSFSLTIGLLLKIAFF